MKNRTSFLAHILKIKNNIMRKKFDVFFDTMPFDERLVFIKTLTISIVRNKQRLNKALEKESKFNQVCRRGSGATAYSKSSQIATIYQDQLDMLRYCVDRL